MNFEEKTISRKEIFQGHIFKVVVDQVELPDGKGQSHREIVLHNGAVAVMALTPENKMIFVKQYRKAIEAITYEIPAGKLEIGEHTDPLSAALRELEEETGYTGDLELVYDVYTAIGFCNEKIKIYMAQNLKKVPNPRPQDEDETLELYELTLEEAKALVASGEICDTKTVMALQYWELRENLK